MTSTFKLPVAPVKAGDGLAISHCPPDLVDTEALKSSTPALLVTVSVCLGGFEPEAAENVRDEGDDLSLPPAPPSVT